MKNWDKVPDDVKEGVRYEIARSGDECDDNHRAYRYKDEFLKKEFIEAERRGCCGTAMSYVIDSNGDKWIVGWNHGH